MCCVALTISVRAPLDVGNFSAPPRTFFAPPRSRPPNELLVQLIHLRCWVTILIVSSSRTVRPCSPWGGRWIGHWRTAWSTVCSSAPHSHAAEEDIPRLYKQERQRPTPVLRRLSRTQALLGMVILGGGCRSVAHCDHFGRVFTRFATSPELWWFTSRGGCRLYQR